MLRVVGRLPLLGACHELGRQASDKPQGRKPREVYARRFGVYSLWGFEGWATDFALCDGVMIMMVLWIGAA